MSAHCMHLPLPRPLADRLHRTHAMEKTRPVPLTDRVTCDNASSIKEYVPKTFQGTATDRHEMSMLGKKQVLRRQFKFMTMLGFASTVSKYENHKDFRIARIKLTSYLVAQSGGLGIRPSGVSIWTG